jgi:hypothetical protein
VYFTDRGLEELAERRGDDQVSLAWLAERLGEFIDLNPGAEDTVDRLATWLARLDDDTSDPDDDTSDPDDDTSDPDDDTSDTSG